jgi:hypothetical protein
MGDWRQNGEIGPMHKYYDPRVFDGLTEEQIKAEFGKPGDPETVEEGLRTMGEGGMCTADDLEKLGFDVRDVGPGEGGEEGGGGGGGGEGVDVRVEVRRGDRVRCGERAGLGAAAAYALAPEVFERAVFDHVA